MGIRPMAPRLVRAAVRLTFVGALGLIAPAAASTPESPSAPLQAENVHAYLPVSLVNAAPPVATALPPATVTMVPATGTATQGPEPSPSPTGTATHDPKASPSPTAPRLSPLGRVHGSVYAAPEPGVRVPVPDVTIRLMSLDGGTEVARATTDLFGAYRIRRQPAGTYGLCWEAPGFPGECGPLVTIADGDVYPDAVAVQAAPGVVHGAVTLAGGEACTMLEPFFSVHSTATVELQDADGARLLGPVRVNANGDFVLAGAPQEGRLRLQARCEGSVAEVGLTALGDTPRHVDLRFGNARPTLSSVEVREGGRGVRRVAPGAVVDVQAVATDPDGDALNWTWRLLAGSGRLEEAAEGRAKWRLPDVAGMYTLYTLVGDGRGGYARGATTLEVRTDGARFGGLVVDGQTGEPVAGAAISVRAGAEPTNVTTDARGYYRLEVPAGGGVAAGEAVIAVRRPGYASRLLTSDGEMANATIHLDPLPPIAVDASREVVLVDERPRLRLEGRRGARVTLPPNTLVAVDGGAPPSGPLSGEIATLDPAFDPLPGRPIGLDREGIPRHLEDYGSVQLAFRDASGRAFAPLPGTRFDLTLPLSATLAVSAPQVLPMWALDGATGLWFGTFDRLTLVDTPAGPAYQGGVTVPNSATAQMIYHGALPDGFNLTCVRVQPDSSVAPGTSIKATVLYFNSPLATFTKLVTGGQTYYPFLQIPRAGVLKLQLLDTKGQPIALAKTTVNLGTRPVQAGEDAANVAYPYSECGAPIPLGIPLPTDIALDASGNPLFLTGYGFYPDYPAQGIAFSDVTQAYYDAIDPNGDRLTLGGWWLANGFDAAGANAGAVRAAYMNFNDLGFGRDMHCLSQGADAACYVTNYGLPDQAPSNADMALAHIGPGATVAMEYTEVPGQPGQRTVKFFAYNGGTAAATRVVAVDLDNTTPKPIPQLCLVCHGGAYDPIGPNASLPDPLLPTGDDVKLGASFREFDLPSLRYPAARDHTQLTAAELQDFRTLNELMRDATAPAAAIVELVDGWYGPVSNPKAGPGPDLSFVPPGWAGLPAETLYTDVVARSCRTCHVARAPGLSFNNYASEFAVRRFSVEYFVCGPAKLMPNAAITFRNFWQSTDPHGPASLAAFADGTTWPAIGVCK